MNVVDYIEIENGVVTNDLQIFDHNGKVSIAIAGNDGYVYFYFMNKDFDKIENTDEDKKNYIVRKFKAYEYRVKRLKII